MQQNLTKKIYDELDMIRLLSKMSDFVIRNEAQNIEQDSFKLIFKDIEKRCWRISEFVEEFDNIKSPIL